MHEYTGPAAARSCALHFASFCAHMKRRHSSLPGDSVLLLRPVSPPRRAALPAPRYVKPPRTRLVPFARAQLPLYVVSKLSAVPAAAFWDVPCSRPRLRRAASGSAHDNNKLRSDGRVLTHARSPGRVPTRSGLRLDTPKRGSAGVRPAQSGHTWVVQSPARKRRCPGAAPSEGKRLNPACSRRFAAMRPSSPGSERLLLDADGWRPVPTPAPHAGQQVYCPPHMGSRKDASSEWSEHAGRILRAGRCRWKSARWPLEASAKRYRARHACCSGAGPGARRGRWIEANGARAET